MFQPTVIEKLVSFHNDPGGDLVIKNTQDIPDEFLTALRHERMDSLHTPAGEMHRVCSIPTVVVDEWKRQGFDINVEPVTEIIKRLKKHDLDAFLTSNKV